MKTKPRFWRRCAAMLALAAFLSVSHATEYTIGNSRIDVSITPEKPSVVLGESVLLIFRIKKVSGDDFTFRRDKYERESGAPWVPSFQIKVTAPDGTEARQPLRGGGGYSGPGPRPFTVTAQSPYECRLALSNYAIVERPGDYALTVHRTLALALDQAENVLESRIVDASTSIKVTAQPPASSQTGSGK